MISLLITETLKERKFYSFFYLHLLAQVKLIMYIKYVKRFFFCGSKVIDIISRRKERNPAERNIIEE